WKRRPSCNGASGRTSSSCGYWLSSRSISPCVKATSGRSDGVRPPASAARPWRASASSAPNQRCARSRTSASLSSADAQLQFAVSLAPCASSSVSALTSSACASGIAGSPAPSRKPSAAAPQPQALGRTPPVRRRRRRKAPEVVEAQLRRCKARKRRRRLRVQVTQQPIAEPVVGQCPQLLLDRLQRAPERRTARQRLLQIERTGIQPHREQAGKPAHRARKVDIGKYLLAPVPFQVDEHPTARPLTSTPPAPP